MHLLTRDNPHLSMYIQLEYILRYRGETHHAVHHSKYHIAGNKGPVVRAPFLRQARPTTLLVVVQFLGTPLGRFAPLLSCSASDSVIKDTSSSLVTIPMDSAVTKRTT